MSDRLVSAVHGPMVDPFDRTANKGVVVGAYDGVVVIGYTGVAYLGGTPTATWLTAWVAGGQPAGGIDGLEVVNAAPGERAYWDETSGTWVAGWAVQPRKPPPYAR
ncbi:MAG: hypothetical protein WEB06_20005 [Actinomycetota bacterium]